MPSYEMINGQEKIQIARYKDDKGTHKKFEDVRKACLKELDECLAKYPPVAVRDTKFWVMRGKKQMLLNCTEDTCEILFDEDEPKKQAPAPHPDQQ